MARALSHVHSIIRGSVGGLTYTANQFYQIIMKNRTAPVQPNTTPQQLARNAITSAQGTWNGLTSIVRQSWQNYSINLNWPDPLGTHKVPGRQVFIAGRSMQDYILAAGLAVPSFVTSAPPSFFGFYLPTTIQIVAPVGLGTGIGVSVGAEASTDGTFLIELSGPWTDTRQRYKGPWQNQYTTAVVVPKATTVVVDFLGFQVDDVIFVRVKAVADDAPPRVSAQTILRGYAVLTGP